MQPHAKQALSNLGAYQALQVGLASADWCRSEGTNTQLQGSVKAQDGTNTYLQNLLRLKAILALHSPLQLQKQAHAFPHAHTSPHTCRLPHVTNAAVPAQQLAANCWTACLQVCIPRSR